jgi:hypothetical protein
MHLLEHGTFFEGFMLFCCGKTLLMPVMEW